MKQREEEQLVIQVDINTKNSRHNADLISEVLENPIQAQCHICGKTDFRANMEEHLSNLYFETLGYEKQINNHYSPSYKPVSEYYKHRTTGEVVTHISGHNIFVHKKCSEVKPCPCGHGIVPKKK